MSVERNFRVKSVQDFIDTVDQIESLHGPESRGTSLSQWTVYRGHGDESYALSPSLYRDVPGVPGFYTREQLLIDEVIRLMPSEFEGLSAFQQLAKLQHFGLPTRMLDVTINPLVALFFACGGSTKVDGEVVVLPRTQILHENAQQVSWISNWAINGSWGSVDCMRVAKAAGLPVERVGAPLFEELIGSLTNPFLAVRPRHTNPRLKAQNGAFLIAGLSIDGAENLGQMGRSFGDRNLVIRPHRFEFGESTDESTSIRIHRPRVLVDGESKPRILRQLNNLDVNEATLFPDPEHCVRYVREGYRNGAFGITYAPRAFVDDDV